MNTPTDRALAEVRKMSPLDRELTLNFFDEHVGPTDDHWLRHPCWTVPAPEVYVALRLMAERGY